MKISSPAFPDGKSIPAELTCDGENRSPELIVEGVPKEARSLAIIMDDPDAPSGLFTHWIAWNIDPKTSRIAEGTSDATGVQGLNSTAKSGYMGPCPPSGKPHRYYFKIYALDTELDLQSGNDRYALELAMMEHVEDKAELMGIYQRQ